MDLAQPENDRSLTIDEFSFVAKKALDVVRDKEKKYKGLWRITPIEELAGWLMKHVKAIQSQGEHLGATDGKERALDIVNYGIFLYHKYEGLE